MPDTSNDLLAQYEAGTGALHLASRNGFGYPANPQLVHDGLDGSAIPDVIQAAVSRDSIYGSVIPAHPTASGTAADIAGGRQVNVTPFTFDWNAWRKHNKENPQDQMGYSGIGGRPVASMGYLQGVEYWVSRDQKSAMGWQQFLRDHYAYAQQPTEHPDGRWSDADQQALEQHMAGIARLESAYAKGENASTRKVDSRILLQEIHRRFGNDNWNAEQDAELLSKDENTRAQAAQTWLISQGDYRDAHGAALARITDLYGDGVLTAAQRHARDTLKDPAWWEQALNAPGDIVMFPIKSVGSLLDALNSHLPGYDAHAHAVAEEAQLLHRNPGYAARVEAFNQLDQQDQAVLAGSFQTAANDRSWLSSGVHWWNEQQTRLQLMLAYTLEDAYSATLGNALGGGEIRGVAKMWHDAETNMGDFMTGLAGEDWVRTHGNYAAFLNIGASLLTPDLLLGPIGKYFELGHLAALASKAAKVDEGITASHAIAGALSGIHSALGMDSQAQHVVSASMREKLAFAIPFIGKNVYGDLMERAIPKIWMNPALSATDRLRLVDALGGHSELADKLDKMLHDESGALRGDLTEKDLRDFYNEHVRHNPTSGMSHYNFAQHLRTLSPEVLRRASPGKAGAIFSIGTFNQGGRYHNLRDAMPAAINKVQYDAAVLGLDMKDLKPYLDALWAARKDPGKAVDAWNAFYDNALKHVTPEEQSRIIDARKNTGGTVATKFQEHIFAPDPKTGAERSVGPRKLEADVKDKVEHLKAQEANLAHIHQDNIEQWYEQQTGHRPVGQQEMDKAVADYEADPKNLNAVLDFESRIADYRKWQAELAPLGLEKGVPMVPGQLSSHVLAPYSTAELALMRHPQIFALERLQAFTRVNEAMSLWRAYTIARPSTVLRAALGDDILRWTMDLMLMGSPVSAINAMIHARLMDSEKGQALLHMLNTTFLGKVASVPLAVAGVPLSVLSGLFHGVGGAISKKQFEEAQALLTPELGSHIHDYLTGGMRHHDGHVPLDPMKDGKRHRDAFIMAMEKTFSGAYAQTWARLYDEQGAAAAYDHLTRMHASSNPALQELREAKGASAADAQAYRNIAHHQQQAEFIDQQLKAADARQRVFTKGPNKGKPDYDPQDYRSIYRSMAHRRAAPGQQAPGQRKSSYRDKVVARRDWHLANAQPNEAMRQITKMTHDYLAEYLHHPDFRKWVADGKVDRDKLDEWYKDPELRSQLPITVGVRDSVEGRGALYRAAMKGPSRFLDRVMAQYIAGARADGAEQMRMWWRGHLDKVYGMNHSWWTPERKNAEAIAQARNWLHNNTYQGTSRIGEGMLRNTSPFLGASNSMRRYFVNQVKAHPWLAHWMAEGASWVDDHSGTLPWRPPILSLMALSGDDFISNPLASIFSAREGAASILPSLSPIFTPLMATMSADSGFRHILEGTPWGKHLPPPETSLGGAVMAGVNDMVPSSYKGLTTAAEETIGVPSAMLGEPAQRQIALRAEQDAAQGNQPSQVEAEREVGRRGLTNIASSVLTPFGIKEEDPYRAQLQAAEAQMRAAKTPDARAAIIAANPDIANALKIRSPDTSLDERNTIRASDPKASAYTTSVLEHPGQPQGKVPWYPQKSQYDEAIGQGDVQVLSADNLYGRMEQQRQMASGGIFYEQRIKSVKTAAMQAGWTPTDPNYITYVKPYLATQYETLRSRFPDFYQRYFGGGTSAQAKAINSQPISTLTAIGDLPMSPELETPQMRAIHTIMQARDLVAGRIAELQYAGATQSQIDAAVEIFHIWITTHFGQDLNMSTFLDLYHWGAWKDFVAVKQAEDYKVLQGA